MGIQRFEWSSELPVPAERAYAWHTRRGAFERLIPPWTSCRVAAREGSAERGTLVLQDGSGPFRRRWVLRQEDPIPGRRLVSRQVEGPFGPWVHRRHFAPLGRGRCRYTDEIEYHPAIGLLARDRTASGLQREARYRHATLAADLALPAWGSLSLVVSGAGGFLGATLLPFLTAAGHQVRRLTRQAREVGDIEWQPEAGRLDPAALEGADAVIHLAGEPIASGRWTGARRRRILASRREGTMLLAGTLAQLRSRPGTLVSASAIGIYGSRGGEVLTETTALAGGDPRTFVEEVGQVWEAAAEAAAASGIRVVTARIGVVLSPAGGALGRMLPPFLAGLGGRLGNGRQYLSWISIDDAVAALYHAVGEDGLSGPVNLTAPTPVTNTEFTRTLAAVLGRHAPFPVPAPLLRAALGPMADELLLASARVVPARLLDSGFLFRHPELGPALEHLLGR